MADDQREEEEKKQTVKRDFLLQIQKDVQSVWNEKKVWELDAEEGDKTPKFMAVFPYPYMNGSLHLGHSFTISKAEFVTGFQRHLGKKALFPFAYHVTGMPIKACADKLRREIDTYGNPPQFPEVKEEEEEKKEEKKKSAADPLKFQAAKTKLKAKAGKGMFQWKIMEQLGISAEDIPKFADAAHWLDFFPPIAQEDLSAMGCKIDHRRSFLTTDVNPFYDSFVRWQFNKLNEMGLCKFGKRFVIWSPIDDQPCADHDRSSGENVQPTEYVVVKIPVKEPYPSALKSLSGKKVSFAAATLRPETMYGQTNCWVLPDGDYAAFEIQEGDVVICAERAARNMSFQGNSLDYGKVTCLLSNIKGKDLIGTALTLPMESHYDVIYTLPMMTVLMDKGTGIVTSVPSDSPADYRTILDLKEKPDLRKKFDILDEWILPYDSVKIIDIEGDTECAKTVCEELKVTSQNDPKLEDAKTIAYRLGFNKGVMIVGSQKGKPVTVAKPLLTQELIEQGNAFKYAEPSDEVISRSGSVCVVALSNQWYLPYGEGEWLKKAKEAVDRMKMYGDSRATRKSFEEALDWLHEWAFSRTYGLGTKVPWDENYLIESLSDSTIYMAYYTIAHLLQGGNLSGSQLGPLGIKHEQMIPEVWDYVFGMSPDVPEKSDIAPEHLKTMRREYEYWYPYDVRVSGKDLVKNHLTFAVYNHVALFEDEKRWPKGVRTNGFLLLNGKKMSKGAGNFLTLRESIQKYSSDAMRMALAEAGDNLDNSNFTHGSANAAILKLFKFVDFVKEMVEKKKSHRTGEFNFRDRVFAAQIDRAIVRATAAYEEMNFREALIAGVFDPKADIDSHIHSTSTLGGPHADLISRYIQVQLLLLDPICPHTMQYIWKDVLGNKEQLLCDVPWPVPFQDVDIKITIQQDKWVGQALSAMRAKIDYEVKQASKKGSNGDKFECSRVVVVVGEHPEFMAETEVFLRKVFNEETNSLPPLKEFAGQLKNLNSLKGNKKAMQLCMKLVKETVDKVAVEGAPALQLGLSFDEVETIQMNCDYLKAALGVKEVSVAREADAGADLPPKRVLSCPGKPATVSLFIQKIE